MIGRIVEIDPNNADAHNNLGNVLEGLGKVTDAEACYRKAISLMPGHAPALNNLGVVLMARKAVEDALDVYARAVNVLRKQLIIATTWATLCEKSAGSTMRLRPTGKRWTSTPHMSLPGRA